MQQFELYIGLVAIIVIVGIISNRIAVPTPLLLVIAGMILSFFPAFPHIELLPALVFNVFLPLLVYEASAGISWPEIKLNKRPIILLSVGHVVFITIIVAVVAHTIIPVLTWPLAFILGAIVSPPDDVAITAIAEKVKIPQRILTVLVGESLLNDASALILFRFALAAAIMHEFSLTRAFSTFVVVCAGEILYGFVLGHVMGQIRLKIRDPKLHMLMSILTPFLAYLPAVQLGGCGVLATVVTGFVIMHFYLERFTPEVRLQWRSTWDVLGFTLQGILFLLVGLNLNMVLQHIAPIPGSILLWYGLIISLVVIVGRFIWVYPSAYLPRFLFPSIRKNDPYPPWQYPFIISWAGMRGGVSLAAAFAIPHLFMTVNGIELRYLLVFLVFCVIIATLLLQGLTLPWILKIFKVSQLDDGDKLNERLAELSAKVEITKAVLAWLASYKEQVKDDVDLMTEVKLQTLEYQFLEKWLSLAIKNYNPSEPSDNIYKHRATSRIYIQIAEIERSVLAKLWHENKITFNIKNKILKSLDLESERITSGGGWL